jgi:S-adenosylmethionine:tRNA ribosyltransferase-isomerase
MKYKLSMFNFDLPEVRIAKKPAAEREDAKLMIVHKKTGDIEHKSVSDLKDFFIEGDVVVLNNTKVFPARLHANKEKTGATIEVFLLRELDKENRLWDVLVDPARKIRIGNKLFFGDKDDLIAEVIDNTTSRGRTLRFLFDGTHEEFKQVITALGETPIPKHIGRSATAQDTARYQTVYAKHEGAVAAPTAGLHFSKVLMKQLELSGIGGRLIKT